MRPIYTICLILILCSVASGVGVAQEEWIPDPNLREVVREALALPEGIPLTQENIRELTSLVAWERGISDLTGLEHAIFLKELSVCHNQISEIRPLTGLIHLEILTLCVNHISDISALSNLINLRVLDMGDNQISDITPITNLSALEAVNFGYNPLDNIQSLANLTKLKYVRLDNTSVEDFTPLSDLNLQELIIDDFCVSPLLSSTLGRINNRSFPSIFEPFETAFFNAGTLINPWEDQRLYDARIPRFDLRFGGYYSGAFGLHWHHSIYGLSTAISGQIEEAIQKRQSYLNQNPTMIYIRQIYIHKHDSLDALPLDSGFWLRDTQDNIVRNEFGEYIMNLLNPALQNLLIKRIIAIAECGLYDGLFIDGFADNGTGFVGAHLYQNHATQKWREDIIAATSYILGSVRERVRDDFLILVNTNRSRPTAYAEYVNGSFMETGRDYEGGYTHQGLQEIDDALLWNEENLREPRINCLEGFALPNQPPDSPDNQRWMRVFTTMGLTHSDGYVTYLFDTGVTSQDRSAVYHYPFWDADLGQPIGEKAQLYKNRDGLFIREFTNGWAVYNRSGAPQAIQLPEQATGVESALRNTFHILPDLDGEIYLKRTTDSHDVNEDGIVNILDLVAVANAFGKNAPDVNGDSVVNVLDLVAVANAFGQ